MNEDRDPVPLRIGVSIAQLDRIDGFQRARGLVSREAAILLLLDLALEAAATDAARAAPIEQARELAERLRAEGHQEVAARFQRITTGARIGHAFLEAVREACQIALTTIEALDPKTALMAEELRLEIDRRLSR